jgi:hypothetical protein
MLFLMSMGVIVVYQICQAFHQRQRTSAGQVRKAKTLPLARLDYLKKGGLYLPQKSL